MDNSIIKKLPTDTVRRIQSEQVVTDLVSAVKELLENALDASSSKVDVILKQQGLETITVKDNGNGISSDDYYTFGQRHYTSKISDFSDLERVTSYGFRGEGLSSVCNLATEVKVTTRTKNEPTATTLTLDRKGQVISKESNVVGEVGTTIVVKGIFENFPVRREYIKKNISSQSKKLYDLFLSYCLVHPQIHLLYHDPPKPRLEKRKMADVKNTLVDIFGPNLVDNLYEIKYEKSADEDSPFHITGFLPSVEADSSLVTRSSNDRSFFYVNHRPVDLPAVAKMLNQKIRAHFELKKKYPFVFLHIEADPSLFDVNYTPNKRQIQFHNQNSLLSSIEEIINGYYPEKPLPLPEPRKELLSRREVDEQIGNLLRSDMDEESKEEEQPQLDMSNTHSPPLTQNYDEDEVNMFQDTNKTVRDTTQSNKSTPGGEKRKREETAELRGVIAKVDMNVIQQKMKMSQQIPNYSQTGQGEQWSLSGRDVQEAFIVGRLDKGQRGQFVIKAGPKNEHLFLVDQCKAEEALLYHELKSHHELKRETLPSPIQLNEKLLVVDKETMRQLDNNFDMWNAILQQNGFEVKRMLGNRFDLVGLSSEVEGLDTSDLAELLVMLSKTKKGETLQVGLYRPRRVLRHLAQKATEKASHSHAKSQNECKELLFKLASCDPLPQTCPHKHSIFKKLLTLQSRDE